MVLTCHYGNQNSISYEILHPHENLWDLQVQKITTI
jgi:hypothetical protein